MFDLEYNTNVGFIPRFAYLESMAASEEDVADETAAREEAAATLNERIDSIPAFDTEVVDTLPEEGVPGTVYLVKEDSKETYSEYVYADGKWERLDTDVDLSGYESVRTTEEIDGVTHDMPTT